MKEPRTYENNHFSVYNDSEYTRSAIMYGVCGCILKPVNRKELNNTLKRLKDDLTNPIETAKRIIEQNYYKDISLEFISEYIHLSQAYFSDQFKEEMGMSFTQYKAL